MPSVFANSGENLIVLDFVTIFMLLLLQYSNQYIQPKDYC